MLNYCFSNADCKTLKNLNSIILDYSEQFETGWICLLQPGFVTTGLIYVLKWIFETDFSRYNRLFILNKFVVTEFHCSCFIKWPNDKKTTIIDFCWFYVYYCLFSWEQRCIIFWHQQVYKYGLNVVKLQRTSLV